MSLPPFTLVNSSKAWAACLAALEQQPVFAIDLEANSLYAYREEICLIQITIPGIDYIVDPLAGFDLEPLGRLIENPEVEKVLHSAEYDLILMKNQFDWDMKNLFDTMWAARILGVQRMGLANILEQEFGVSLNKKFQKANWCQRPLEAEKLVYAQSDTHYLLELRKRMTVALKEGGYWQEAQEIFSEQCEVEIPDRTFDPDDFWHMRDVRKLNRKQQAVAKALFIYRDQQASRQNKPTFRIFGDRTIIELATKLPANTKELSDVYGMTRYQINRFGEGILSTIARAQHAPPPERPRPPKRRHKAISKRYDLLHRWRKNQARKRGVESDVILNRSTLWELAERNPKTSPELSQIESLGPWRRQQYGDELLQLLSGA